jgi:hypothetical protein
MTRSAAAPGQRGVVREIRSSGAAMHFSAKGLGKAG